MELAAGTKPLTPPGKSARRGDVWKVENENWMSNTTAVSNCFTYGENVTLTMASPERKPEKCLNNFSKK